MIKPWYGFTFISLILYGFWGFWGAKTSAEVGARSANFYAAVGTFVVGLLCITLMNFKPVFTVKGMTYGVLTGAATGIGTLFFLAALRLGPAIPIIIITALYPLVSTVLLIIFFDQTITLKQFIGIIFSLVALVLLS
ncbi:EamA family transporter [Legionella sp. W05-934-2]|jgi:uncharacterized membrane protein|uniref:EamA family transporter n=1 Tax=Legionella sp. W05-934-2 TaxID=1198649 RepID=UPI0034630936